MPALTGKFNASDGPTVSVLIGNSYAYSLAGGSMHQPVKRRMLIDTGARCSVLEREVFAELRIRTEQSGATTWRDGEKLERHRGDVSLVISGSEGAAWTIPFALLEVEDKKGYYSEYGFAGLIGRDVLSGALFRYEGWAHKFSLEWKKEPFLRKLLFHRTD